MPHLQLTYVAKVCPRKLISADELKKVIGGEGRVYGTCLIVSW